MKISVDKPIPSFHPITIVIETAEEANMLRSLLAPLNSHQVEDLWGLSKEEDTSYRLFEVLDDAVDPLGMSLVPITINASA